MTKPFRLLLFSAALACVALGGAAHALGGGQGNGYSYATIGASSNAYGITARIAQLRASEILSGHVAAWVGVGGSGEGLYGSNEWLRVGITGSGIYYEVARPNLYPMYHEIRTGVTVGTYTRVSALEMHNRPNWWRVWVNHKPVSPPILFPESHDGLRATAKSECWDGGTDVQCTDFPFSFRDVSIARAPGGAGNISPANPSRAA